MFIRTCFMLLLFSPFVFSQDQKLTIKKVDVFKNGSAFITAEGTLNFDKSEATLSFIPQAMFGTLWMSSLEKQSLVTDIKVINQTVLSKRKCATMVELLNSNIGKTILFSRTDDRKNSIQGLLQSVYGTDDRYVVTIKNNQQISALSAYWYNTTVEFPGGMNDMTTDTLESQVLKIKTTSGLSSQKMSLMYFMNQLGWVPSYYVDLVDEKNASISLTATLMNDAMDLDNVELNFVVGFPNFVYKNVETPLSNKAAINDFMRSLAGAERRPSYQYQSALTNQSIMRFDEANAYDFDGGDFTSINGSSEEDLFFYPLPKVSLKKSERAIYQIFSAVIPYTHIYEVSLTNHLTRNKGAGDETAQVWHSLKLENKTNHPWTTGSGMTLQNGRALGMDILKYTPKGSSGKLKITVSPDIQVSDDEKELERKQDFRKKDGYYYDLVKIEGEISVKNYKDKMVALQVSKSITGKILNAGSGGKIKQIPNARDVLNSENQLEWELKINSGDTGKITYQYEVLLRH